MKKKYIEQVPWRHIMLAPHIYKHHLLSDYF